MFQVGVTGIGEEEEEMTRAINGNCKLKSVYLTVT
jgi:hypothetical protein